MARERRRHAETEAGRIVAEARRTSAAVRAEIAAQAGAAARSEGDVAIAAAEAEAAAIESRAEQRMPGFVERVIVSVRAAGGIATSASFEKSRS
jgi:hypothetical protein